MLSEEEKRIYVETAELLRDREKRIFMARVVKLLGRGGQRFAERELLWNRGTIRKGMREIKSVNKPETKIETRGRKPVEAKLPNLLIDIQKTMDALNETDPTFQMTRFYTGVTINTLRKCLIAESGYTNKQLPSNETLRIRIKKLGYHLKRP